MAKLCSGWFRPLPREHMARAHRLWRGGQAQPLRGLSFQGARLSTAADQGVAWPWKGQTSQHLQRAVWVGRVCPAQTGTLSVHRLPESIVSTPLVLTAPPHVLLDEPAAGPAPSCSVLTNGEMRG